MRKVTLDMIFTDEQAAAIERALQEQNEYLKSKKESTWSLEHFVEVLAFGAVEEIARKEIEEE